MQLEEHIEIVLHTVPEYAYALQQAVAEVSGSPKVSTIRLPLVPMFLIDDLSVGGVEILQADLHT